MRKKIIIESMYLYNYSNPEEGVTVGGSQRYSLDLGYMFYKMGYEVIFLTKAKENIETNYEGWAKIVAFDSAFGEKGRINFSKRVYLYCKNNSPDIVCYSDLEIGYPYCYENSFALQHGVAWDNPYDKIKNWIKSYFYLKAIKKYKKIICVDTNFINWCRERDIYCFNNPDKFVYIPNYADENQFNYEYREWRSEECFSLLYPRRLVNHRGFEIFLDMCKELKGRGYNIEPILAIEKFKGEDFKKQYPQYKELNCKIVHPKMEDIHKLYKEAFLSFVPTKWSEGTSLSAIESMSSGCPVIVSDVGGLGNIVLPGFNGYLTSPSVESFLNITEYLLKNVEKRNELAKNCKNMNLIFGKKRWENEIIHALKPFL